MTEKMCRQWLELSDFEVLIWNWKPFSGAWPSVCDKFHHSRLLCTWLDSRIYDDCLATLAFEFTDPWPTCKASTVSGFIQINEAENPPHTFRLLLWPFSLLWFVLLSATPSFRINLYYPCQLYLYLSYSIIRSASYYHFVYIYIPITR